jgi:hypothetical protein
MMIVVVVVVVVMIAVVIMVMIVATITVVPALRVMMLMARYVFMLVPIVTDEEHGATAGVVLGAVPCPMLLMAGRHMQIHGLIGKRRIPVNHDGTRIHQRWGLWYVTDIDLTKESGLADIDGHTEIGGHYRCGDK